MHIEKRVHPDVHWLTPSGASEQVKIEDVRQVMGRIALRPFHARCHVVIIDGADRLTDEAANTLLKSLEEPPGLTCFLLVAARVSRCLPTIVSRCQLIRCQRLAPQAIEALLASSDACPRDAAGTIALLSEGSAGHALKLAQRWSEHRELLAYLSSDELSSWLARPLPETRDEAKQLLEGLMAWLRDVALCATESGPPRTARGGEGSVAVGGRPRPTESVHPAERGGRAPGGHSRSPACPGPDAGGAGGAEGGRTASTGASQYLTHRDAAAAIQRQAARVPPDRCVEAMMALHELRESLEQFANPRLVASMARETWLETMSA